MKPQWLLLALAGPLACTAININFDPEEDAETESSPDTDADSQSGGVVPGTSTSGVDDTASDVTGGVDTGSPDTGQPPDTDGPPAEDTGDPLECEPEFGPLELTIITAQGLESHPDLATCSTSASLLGRYSAGPDGSLEVRPCPGGCDQMCQAQPSNTVYFGDAAVIPPDFEGCGSVDFWSGYSANGDCGWQGVTAWDEDDPEPRLVGTNDRLVAYWPPADAKATPMKECAIESQCNGGLIGLHFLVFNDDTEVHVAATEDVDLGTGTIFTVTNHMAIMDEQCELYVAWSGYRYLR